MNLSADIKNQFLLFMAGEITIDDFEQWVYSNENLAKALGEEKYLELIEFNFKKSGATYDLLKLIADCLNPGEIYRYKITKLIKDLEREGEDFYEVLIECYHFYCKGCFFLEDLGLAWGLMLECPSGHYKVESWRELSNDQKMAMVKNLDLDEIRIEVSLLKKWIEKNEIVFNGQIDKLGYWKFIDHRPEDEKKSRMWVRKLDDGK